MAVVRKPPRWYARPARLTVVESVATATGESIIDRQGTRMVNSAAQGTGDNHVAYGYVCAVL